MTDTALTVPPATASIERSDEDLAALGLNAADFDYLVALAGNPNTGKSTVFNALTGLRQHTGNWPGKTVTRAIGGFDHEGKRMMLVDLPGTYSLQAGSTDEEVARDFVLFGRPDVTVVVVDATRLERNLNLALQVLEITNRVVICLNLMDEAGRHGIAVNPVALADELGVPVVPTTARTGEGISELVRQMHLVASGKIKTTPHRIETYPAEVETAVSELTASVRTAFPDLPNTRWVALRLLNADARVEQAVRSGDLGNLRTGEEAMDGAVLSTNSESGSIIETASRLRWNLSAAFHDRLTESIYREASAIASRTVTRSEDGGRELDAALDRILTSKWLGFPLMGLALAVVLWITITGANYPSSWLSTLLLEIMHPALKGLSAGIGVPGWLDGLVVDGVYLATAWVVSVMLPPMAIFFPLFTLLEDFGYLPRVAFNMDKLFQKCGAHGKQALTMCMGFGCNAAGVVATRVIDSPRERLIAIITNNFSLCNGRWPTQILIATIFLGATVPAHMSGLAATGSVVAIAVLGMVAMFSTSWLLSRTVLEGEATTFSLELPPYRPPRLMQTLYTSLIDRTLIILWRAVKFAAPAGAVIWLISNLHIGGVTLADHMIGFLNPFGILIGLNGVILLAYIVAIPANEIVIPTILMLTVLTVSGLAGGAGAGVMFQPDSTFAMADLLRAGGWTLLTGVNLMLFSLLHNPCSTTIYTIYKETGSTKWTSVAALLPLLMGLVVCFLVAQIWRLLA